MDIRQPAIRYHIEQDRILIRVNPSLGDEVHMWLTRRMALRLWPLINQVVVDPTATALTVKVAEEPADDADFAPDAPRPTYLN